MITKQVNLGILTMLVFSLSSTAAISAELAERKQAAQQVSKQLIQQLGSNLKREMKTNGPVQAITVCKDLAPSIANNLSLENGWRVTRVSTRTRNSLLGTPDLFERKALASFESRAAKGEAFKGMVHAEVTDENDKSYYRYMQPLVVQQVCLTCHGSDEQIPAQVKLQLDKQYPFDWARNYKVGDLRGAVSIKQPMDVPLKK